LLYYLSCYIFFPENKEYLNENFFPCLCCVYTFYFIGRIIDIDSMFDIFTYLSAFCILMNLFYYLVYAPDQKNMEEVANDDNMYVAYRALPHVAMLLWATFNKFKFWKAILTFFGFMFLLSCGTRGPLVCLGVFGLIYFFFYMNFKGAIFVKAGLIFFSLVILANMRTIALAIARIFLEMQLSTRILQKFVAGELSNDTYRSVLRDKLYEVLDSGNHLFGLGLFGTNNYNIAYPHFLPLDIWCTYGYLFGSLLLLLLVFLIGYALWISRGTKSQIFILLLCSISIVKLMFSATFVSEPFLYLLIGFCIKQLFSHSMQQTRESTQPCLN